ncbi:MAG: TIGR02147 family protein [Bdellovibrio sp.]|nr:TIGR02147 family protein [Bdellovibrio sp.]
MQKDKDSNLEQFRGALQREFIERAQKNPAYSLRAFAKNLGIDQSFLSKVLKGQRPITANLVATIGPKLGLKPQQVKKLFTAGTAAMPNFLSLTDDEFDHLSEWHHFAILELSKTESFDPSPKKIAQRLGLHIEEVRAALSRLERLGFVRIVDGKFQVLAPNTTWTNTSTSSEARRQFQKKLLTKGLEAIEDTPFDLRENGSLTVAINKKRLPEFKEKLRLMRKELADFFQEDNEPGLDEVYQLTVALFPLTKIKNEKHGVEQ